MFKFLIIIFISLQFVACSHYSNYFQKSGNLSLSGGRFGNLSWNDDLNFDRHSWFKELNMYFDILSTRFEPKSGFKHWLSVSEINSLRDCKSSGILLYFDSDNPITSSTDFKNQLKNQGLEVIESNNFKKYLISHPDVLNLGLVDYSINLICNNGSKSLFTVIFPGFREVKFHF